MAKGKFVDPEAFVRAWQASTSIKEVVAATGMREGSVISRAKAYRDHGVPLRLFPKNKPVDWKALVDLANSLTTGGAS